MRRLTLISLTALALSAMPALAQVTAITGGRVLTGTSVIENGTVVIQNGRIVSVGTGAAPQGARVIDARGKVVTPGLRGDVVIWSANPFSVYARADQVFIDGALTFDRFDPRYQPVSDFELGQPGFGIAAANIVPGAR